MSDRLALLERAQQGDDRAEAQLLTENGPSACQRGSSLSRGQAFCCH